MNEQRHMLTLPAKIADMEELTRLCADRFRRIGEILGTLGLDTDQDMTGRRVRNLGAPVADSDAVTLGFLRQALSRVKAVATTTSGGQTINVGVTGAAIEIVRVLLTDPTTAIDIAGAQEGLVVALILEQDATGGRAVTWPAGWPGMAPFQPSTAPEHASVFLFGFLSSTEARLLAPPIRGVDLS